MRGTKVFGGAALAVALVVSAGAGASAAPGDVAPGWPSDGVNNAEGSSSFGGVEVLSDGTILLAFHDDESPEGDDTTSLKLYSPSGGLLDTLHVDQTDDRTAFGDLDARGDHAYLVVNQKASEGWYIEIRRIVSTGLDTDWGDEGVVRFGAGAALAYGLAVAASSDGGFFVIGGGKLYKFDAAGEPDLSFNGDGVAAIPLGDKVAFTDLDVDGSGRIAAIGARCTSERCRGIVARMNPNGSPTKTFGKNGVRTILHPDSDSLDLNSVTWTKDGKLVVAGYRVTTLGIKTWLTTARLSPTTGKVDTTFGGNGWASFRLASQVMYGGYAAVQNNGRVVLVGGNHDHWLIVRFTAAGERDKTFATKGVIDMAVGDAPIALATDVAIDTQNKRIVVAGTESDDDYDHFVALGSFTMS